MPFVPGFLPSQNAPLFANGPWPPGTSLAVSIEGLPSVNLDITRMGLCGGMSFLTRDIFESGTPQLRGTDSTKIPVALADFIAGRLVQSFGGPGTIVRWYQLTTLPDNDTTFRGPGVFHQTVDECPGIMSDIDGGRLSPIGVVLVNSWWPGDVFGNHVELVYGYEKTAEGQLTLHVYDCNHPDNDDITISLDISSTSPVKVISTNGTPDLTPDVIRGFFRLPYTHSDPTPAYIDDAGLYVMRDPPVEMTPGSTATPTVVAVNTGSTSWTPAQKIRLGSQAPQDNATWGTARVELPIAQVDPQDSVIFDIPITAPSSTGDHAFSWQMVRDPDMFFGSASYPQMEIAVEPIPLPVVPDVLTFSEAEAKQAILAARLTSQVEFTESGADPGCVAFQRPPGGTITTVGAVVTIAITEKKVPPP